VTWRSKERTGSECSGGSLREPPRVRLAVTWRSWERTGSEHNMGSLREPPGCLLTATWRSYERTGSAGSWDLQVGGPANENGYPWEVGPAGTWPGILGEPGSLLPPKEGGRVAVPDKVLHEG
jgi:hypothetical protein